jgi:hypothetical protein
MKTLLAFFLSLSLHAQAWINEGTARTVYVKHKSIHALGGLAVYGFFDHAGYPKTGLCVVLALGILKELYDRRNGGTFRPGDVAWTIGPASVVYLIRF